MDEVITPDLAALVCEQIRAFIICQTTPRSAGRSLGPVPVVVTSPPVAEETSTTEDSETPRSFEKEKKNQVSDESIAADLAKLQVAYDRQILYIIGKEQMKVKTGTRIWRKVLLNTFLWLRENTRTKIANLRVPTDRVIEVGFVKDV